MPFYKYNQWNKIIFYTHILKTDIAIFIVRMGSKEGKDALGEISFSQRGGAGLEKPWQRGEGMPGDYR